MSNIIKFKVPKGSKHPGLREPVCGNPNPGDPNQPSPPTHIDLAEPGTEFTVAQLRVPNTLKLTPDLQKALGILFNEGTYLCIGIRPSENGADFVTSCDGDATALRNAMDELPGVIERLFRRKGVIQ